MKRSILSAKDMTLDFAEAMALTGQCVQRPQAIGQCRQIIGLIFDQPSHRTRNSFSSASVRIGGAALDLSGAMTDSITRGEPVADFVRTAQEYVDCLVVRSSDPELARFIDSEVRISVINAGNGHEEHPTQALGDYSYLRSVIGTLDDLKIALIGNIRDSRCANSLITLLSPLRPRVLQVCPDQFKMRDEWQACCDERGANFVHSSRLIDAGWARVLYFTGCLPEDFSDSSEWEQFADWWTETPLGPNDLGSNGIVMHPLPRGNELPAIWDSDIRFGAFEQVRHGLGVRQRLLMWIAE